MMFDRYLYRGKRLLDNEWIFGQLLLISDTRVAITDEYLRSNTRHSISKKDVYGMGCLHYHEIDISTLGQCIDLKDKNNKLIYEGDIVKLDGENSSFIGKIVWSNSVFMIEPLSLNHGNMSIIYYKNKNAEIKTDIEIIGDIYDD